MARTRKSTTSEAPLTTAQQLGSIIKSARDIMRKDKGLNGDLDRLPMLVWIMFLKFIDDMELIREQEAAIKGEKFRPAIEAPYRWRDWAAKEDGITGDCPNRFHKSRQGDAARRLGRQGLFAYLRNLQGANGGDRRDVIATHFPGHSQPDDYRLPSAGCHQQDKRDSLQLLGGDSHTEPSLRVDAQRDEGCRWRFGRVLHAPASGPVHGRGN